MHRLLPKGPYIKDVRRDGGGCRSNADRGGGACKDLADVRKLEHFKLFQHALQTVSMGDA